MRALVALLAASAGCSLIDLDPLQSGVASGGATSGSTTATTSGSPTSSSSSGSVTATSTTSTSSDASTSGASTTSSGGCVDMFCATQTGLDGCADFDSAAYTLGTGWNPAISLNGATMGTVTTSSDDFTSCPTSAVVDIDAKPNGRSWVQIARVLPMTGKTKATFSARVNRSGPGGVPVDGAGLLEVAWDTGANTYCQVYVQLYDAPAPMSSGSYFFLQHWNGSQTIQLTADNLDLPAPTANVWASVKLAVDWAGDSITTTVNGVSKAILVPAECNTPPSSVTAGWGVAYEDKSQTIRFDDLTARGE